MRAIAFFLTCAIIPLSINAGRVEQITLDLERPARPFALTVTEATDVTVRANLLSAGAEFDPTGWTGLLWIGDRGGDGGGMTLTNVTAVHGRMTWDLAATAAPTNGRYDAIILGARDGRIEEWGRGAAVVRLNPARTSLPAEWIVGDRAYAVATQALAIASAAATTQQVAAVVGPLQSRIGNIEQNTNRWDLAHSWGNHAEAGYFLASGIVNYYTRSQTDQEISSAIDAVVFPVTSVNGKTGDVVVATDRIATLDGDRWIDATGSVWLVGPTAVTNWFYTDSISPATTSVLDGLSFPLPPEFYIETPHGYISGTSEPPYAPIHTEIWLGEDIGALWGTASATDGIYATDWFGWSRLFSREVMTIKTQRVDRVALQSELKNTIYARPEADGKHSLWIREETP